ncbi:serine hydrolase domain-containing protein [Lysobacter niastensis]|uniref:serine hydrolase domain-containing protein n=1 Tax=Lysobacter niastensis TaxID=380629 RepID=UPI001E5A0451|nr:serine hydrolase domain-containing protein [Lysobacter niastensis]
MKPRHWMFGVACALMMAPAMAASPSMATIDTAFEDAVARYRLPGLAVGIVEDGRVTYMRTSGERVAGSGEKIDADTLFKVASNTKAMTTALLARLVDQGKLRWDDPVVRHLPQFRMHDAWVSQEMQVRDLLIHNSGLRAGAGDLMLWPEPNAFARDDIIHGLAYLKPLYSFRSRYAYDNLLYIVAGEVAAAAGGASYETLLQREVFEPLGMKRCRVGQWNRDEVGNVAQPHMRQGDNNVPVRADGEVIPATTMAAAGGVRCSLDDMLAWVQAWLREEPAQSSWLSRDQRRALWSAQMPMPLSDRQRRWDNAHYSAYGYGWRLSDVDGTFKVAHTGTLMGMYSAVTLLPDKHVGFVIMANGEAEEARTVLTQVLVKHFTAPADARKVADYARDLDRERADTPPAKRAPDTSARAVAAIEAMRPWLGHYRDPWFGEVSVCPGNSGHVRFTSLKSPMLSGVVQNVGGRWLVDWDDASVDAEAWLDFASHGQTVSLNMSKVDPEADFSYDYEDLAFTRTGRCN